MNVNYPEVPNIITGKDLDYISDMFHWNYDLYKKTQNCVEQVGDADIKNMIVKSSNIFLQNMNVLLSILMEESNE